MYICILRSAILYHGVPMPRTTKRVIKVARRKHSRTRAAFYSLHTRFLYTCICTRVYTYIYLFIYPHSLCSWYLFCIHIHMRAIYLFHVYAYICISFSTANTRTARLLFFLFRKFLSPCCIKLPMRASSRLRRYSGPVRSRLLRSLITVTVAAHCQRGTALV